MPDFGYSDIRSAARDTALGISGTIAVPIVNGPFINTDRIRYIWRIKATNNNAAPHIMYVFAWDGVAAALHQVLAILVPAFANITYPDDATPDKPIIRVRPDTSGVAGVNAETAVWFGDEGAGGNFTAVSYSYYDKKG